MNNINSQQKLCLKLQTLKVIPEVDAFFQALSDNGHNTGAILFKLGNTDSKYAHLSIGIYHSSLSIRGKDQNFTIESFDDRGDYLLDLIVPQLQHLNIKHQHTAHKINGSLSIDLSQVELNQRLCANNHMQLIRLCLFNMSKEHPIKRLPLGLYGCFAFDFIDQFEQLAPYQQDCLKDDDYVFYLPSKLFIVDHQKQLTRLLSIIPSEGEHYLTEAQHDIDHMHQTLQNTHVFNKQAYQCGEISSDTSFEEFSQATANIIEHIKQGDAYQVVYGRLMQTSFSGEALDVFHQLSHLNPSPFEFFMNDDQTYLVGCSPELALRVIEKEHHKNCYQIEIHPIAGTKPRGFAQDKIDPITDQRYTISMQVDGKELAEHTMLIDLARNDIAAVAKTGTTLVTESFNIAKYSHVQHLVSKVIGELSNEYDALQAYLATMNMGTLTGAPKTSALNIIRKLEKNARGYFGGAFGFMTADGELETTIVIRSIRFKQQNAYVRAAGGIVVDSLSSHEWQETVHKASSCIKALQGSHNE